MCRIPRLCALLLLVSAATACRNPVSHAPEPDVLATRSSAEKQERDVSGGKKMLPKHMVEKKEIIVGGCREACAAPKDAFRNFIRTLFGVMPESSPELLRFVDTTLLVDNGRRWGDEWADMWLSGKLDERRQSVADWMDGYRRRVGSLAGNPSDVEGALEAGMQFRRISSEQVEMEFVPPARDGASNSERWKLRLGLRGLEWLIQEIYD